MAKRNNIHEYHLQSLIDWRNIASRRIDNNRKDMVVYINTIRNLDKKIYSDIQWVTQLNKEISKRVFPGRNNESKELSKLFNF